MSNDISQVRAKVDVSINELISPYDMVNYFTKAKKQISLAPILVAELIDEETRIQSNIQV